MTAAQPKELHSLWRHFLRARGNWYVVIARRRAVAEVPPFAEIIVEPALAHGGDQRIAMAPLLRVDSTACGVARRVQAVVARAPVEGVLGGGFAGAGRHHG